MYKISQQQTFAILPNCYIKLLLFFTDEFLATTPATHRVESPELLDQNNDRTTPPNMKSLADEYESEEVIKILVV